MTLGLILDIAQIKILKSHGQKQIAICKGETI